MCKLNIWPIFEDVGGAGEGGKEWPDWEIGTHTCYKPVLQVLVTDISQSASTVVTTAV